MIRSSRLINERIESYLTGCTMTIYEAERMKQPTEPYEKDKVRMRGYQRHIQVHPGDEMTGWEIIAGLPLEEQQFNGIRSCPYQKGLWRPDSCAATGCMLCWFKALKKLYRWNGESWEAVE